MSDCKNYLENSDKFELREDGKYYSKFIVSGLKYRLTLKDSDVLCELWSDFDSIWVVIWLHPYGLLDWGDL